MSFFDWLHERAPGLPAFTDAERAAISEFSLLWSLFEARALSSSASAARIVDLAKSWRDTGMLAGDTFATALGYFRNRYFLNGQETAHFEHLHLRANDQPALVRAVLSGESKGIAEDCAVVFIVIYRYRNNLFHGEKWTYWLQGQLDNFTCANTALKKGLELIGPLT